jgi:hypothetical protein
MSFDFLIVLALDLSFSVRVLAWSGVGPVRWEIAKIGHSSSDA